MSLLPELERELLRVARTPEREGGPARTAHREAVPGRVTEPGGVPGRRPPGLGPLIRRSLPATALILVVAAALTVGGVFLAGLRSGRPAGAGGGPASSTGNSLFPGAPTTQRGGWMGGGNLCPLAAPNRYLPARSGCVSAAPAGRRNLVLLYAHLSRRRVGRLYVPSFFTLEVLRYRRVTLRARLRRAESNPVILLIGRSTALQGVKVFIETGHISSGSSAVVYSLWRGRLVPAGVTLSFGRDSAQAATFQCQTGHPPTVVQRSWVLERGGENGWWRRRVTTFAWHGPRLARTGQASALRRGLPAPRAPGRGCVPGTPARARSAIQVVPPPSR